MTEHAIVTSEAPAAMAPQPHCSTCRCRVTLHGHEEAAFQELKRRSAVTDAEILAILDEGDRLARIGKEGRGAE